VDITDAIIRYRRFLKRRNVSPNTVKHYLNSLKHFVLWLDVPIETVTYRKIAEYIDCLLRQRLRPKTINCYLNTVCQFYHYLGEEEGIPIVNPVKKPNIMKLPRGASQASERRTHRAPLQESERAKGSSHVYDYAPMRITGGRSCPSFPR
jgi:site-specific recombinase XerD